MNDIPQFRNWTRIEPINKGWSKDKKYYIVTKTGEKLLLRVSDISEYDKKQLEYKLMKKLESIDILMSRPLDFGVCNEGESVYLLLTWIDGKDAENALPKLIEKEQYELGISAGRLLRKIHSIPAPKNQIPWAERFNRKIDRNKNTYNLCGIIIHGAEKIIEYIEQSRHLLNNRPQSFQHGDYHVGNMIVTKNGEIGIIDFNRLDFGDPWEEFNRIVWCANSSEAFASGRINGYFDNDPPELFFRLMALYIACNQLSSVAWAIPFGQSEVGTMLKQASDVLDWYSDFQSFIPKWYLPYRFK